MSRTSQDRTILGLDLGSNSIGWALLSADGKKPQSIIDCGVRIFQAGLEGDIESGNAVSRARERREKRSLRRQADRKQMRKEHLLHLLQRLGLLPQGLAQDIFPALDKDLINRYKSQNDEQNPCKLSNIFPYWLRKRALDYPLKPYELGRVLYHLGQRRGFLSNRKSPSAQDDGTVITSISELRQRMNEAGSRTLGEYLVNLNPHEERIRNRYTHREMYQEEFEEICSFQRQTHSVLNGKNIESLRKTIFFQRPLKSAKNLVGYCELESNSRRAPWSSIEAQCFRYLQMINNCSIKTAINEIFRPLNSREKETLVSKLESDGDLTFIQAKKLLGYKPKEVVFSLEAGEEKRFVGNRINKELKQVFGESWFSFEKEKKEKIISDLRSYRDNKALAERAQKTWSLDQLKAQEFADIELEPGYCALSRKAILKLIPLLEKGYSYPKAKNEVYGDFLRENLEVLPFLPPVKSCFEIRNPVVERSLTEVRKVVNAIIRKHGKPDYVRIELARELKQSQKKRKEITKQNRLNEKRRTDAAELIAREVGLNNPSRNDILKVLLWDECNGVCPYTSQPISMKDLFGENPQFDIEHIIPFSRSFDDSFANKTLCYSEENRSVKRNRAPWEVYQGGTKWEQITGNVKRFKGDFRDVKLKKFMMRPEDIEELDGFISRQMNDTRYASKLAVQYLGALYGGFIDKESHQRVFSVTGQITGILRNAWSMNAILGDGGNKKTRNDHRHHAVDAVAIALTNPTVIQNLSQAALPSYERKLYRKRFKLCQLPWPTFLEELRETIDRITVSHRVNHKVNAALHDETHYGIVKNHCGNEFCIRRRIDTLKTSEVDQIIDKRVKNIVQRKLDELKLEPSKAFSDSNNHPYFISEKGNRVWVHKVRISVSAKAKKIGNGVNSRYVTPKSNHHLELFDVSEKGKEGSISKWECEVVDTLEAMERLRTGKQLVSKGYRDNQVFLFSLTSGDTIKLNKPGDWP